MSYSSGMVLLIVCGVLGGLVVILGSIYTYIYCTKIRPRRKPKRDYNNQWDPAHNPSSSEPEKGRIKTHPFFIVKYFKKSEKERLGPT